MYECWDESKGLGWWGHGPVAVLVIEDVHVHHLHTLATRFLQLVAHNVERLAAGQVLRSYPEASS